MARTIGIFVAVLDLAICFLLIWWPVILAVLLLLILYAWLPP